MVRYVRIGSSRVYVPAAFATNFSTARIAFVRDPDYSDPGAEIDVLSHLNRGAMVMFPTISRTVASSLHVNVPRLLDEATLPNQRIRLAFLSSSGGLRAGETVAANNAGAVTGRPSLYVGDQNETNDTSWRLKIPGSATIGSKDGALILDLSASNVQEGGLYVNNIQIPISPTNRQIRMDLEGRFRGTLRFVLEMDDAILENLGVGLRYFAQESFDEGTLYTAASTYPLYRLGKEKRSFTCQLDMASPYEMEPTGTAFAPETLVPRTPRSLLLPPTEALRTNLHALHGADVHLLADSKDDARAGFALTSSPKAISSVGGENIAFIRSHYFSPVGTFSIEAGESPQLRLSLGLSNLESMALRPGLDKLTFVTGFAAYDSRVNDLCQGLNGQSVPTLIDLDGLCQTSWLRLDLGYSATPSGPLSIQPEGMQAYRAVPGNAPTMAFSATRFPAPSEPFPLVPLLGLHGDTAKQRLRIESDVIAKARRARIMGDSAVRANAFTEALALVESRTPQGFIAVRSENGTAWSKLQFAKTSKRPDANGVHNELGDVALQVKPGTESVVLLSETMTQNKLMLVTTWRTMEKLGFDLDAFKRMHVGGWGIQLAPITEGDDPIVVIKYDNRPLRQLARERDQWAAPGKFDPDDKLQGRLLPILDSAKANDDLLSKFARRIDDPNWNGLLVLDAKLPLTGFPEQMKAIAAGLPPSLKVPYLGLDVSGIDPEQPLGEPWRSALFGLVHHDEKDPDWEGDNESKVKMRVPRLVLRVENDAIDRFECTIHLCIPRLFDFESTKPDEILELKGRYESRVSNGKRHDSYIFEAGGNYRKEFGAKSVIRSISIQRLRLITTPSSGKYTEGRFLIDGDITFNELGGVDLLGIEKLEFTDFAIDLGFFIEGVRNLKLKFNYPKLKFDLDGFNTGSGRRPNLPGFLRSFPLKLRGIRFGEFDLQNLGFLQLGNLDSTDGFEIGSDFKFALDFDLDLGSLGALAKKLERFKLQVLIGWKPIWENDSFKKNRIAAGFRIDLGEGSGGIDLGLQDILRLRAQRFNFKREQVDGEDLIILSADDCRLDVLGNEFPENGKFSLFLFANLGDSNPFELPGWYASFKDPNAEPPIAIEHLVMAQRVDVNLGEVTTTREVLAWLGKQETFDKSDPDAAAKFIKFASKHGGVRYDRNREWFIAMKGDFFKICRIAVLLKDPDVYGAYVGLLAEDDPSQAIMSFDLLYQKLADGVGRYVVEVGLPPGYRSFEVGVASVTIGMIRFEIFTDGGFLIDLGFPEHVDFSRSFAVQAAIFIGKGGLYLGRTPAVTVPNIPPGYGQVMRTGFAMKVGLGREFEYGPIRAGLSLCVFGRTEGYFAAASDLRDTHGNLIAKYPYWMRLQGEMGIIAEIEGSVDLRLIRARLLIRIWVATGIVLETALPVLLYCEAGVSVAVEFEIGSFRIFGKKIRITIMLRYSTTLRFEYTLPVRIPVFGSNASMLVELSEKAALADWPVVWNLAQLGEQSAAMDLRLGYDLARTEDGRLVAVPTLMWLEGDGQNAGTCPFATLARALIGWAALRSSPDTASALDIVIRKGIDPKGSSVFGFDDLQQAVLELDDVPLELLESLLDLVLKGSKIAHVKETGDEGENGYICPIPFGLRLECERDGQTNDFDYSSLGTIGEQAIIGMLEKFERQFVEIEQRPTDANLLAADDQPLVRYLFRSWCAALALAALDAARTEWKLNKVFEDRSLRNVLADVPDQQWKNAAARAGRMFLSGVRVEDEGHSKALFDRAGLFIEVPVGGKTKLLLVEPSVEKWFTVTASELELDTSRVAAMATAAVFIDSKTVRPLAVRILPRRFFLPRAREMRVDAALAMRLAQFGTDLLAQFGATEFRALAFSARDPATSQAPTPVSTGIPLQKPSAAMAFEVGLQRVVSGQANDTAISYVPGAFQLLGAHEADRLGLDAIMALTSADMGALKLTDTQLHIGWRTGSPDNEYVQLLSLSANVLDKVFVTRSTVTVQRRPYVDFTPSAAGAGAAPEEIFRADFTPQSRYALLYLLQRAAVVNAKGTHLLLPATLAKPLEAFFEEVAEKGRDRIDLMFTLVFADNAKVPAGAINSALFELPADVQALQHPRLAAVELATVPDIDVAGWQEDNMLEVIALRPAGTELVRTWRRRVTVDGSGAASEAEFGKYLAARFDMQEFEVTDVGSGTPLIDADDALPQASEVAIPNEYPEQMRNWLAAEKPVGFDDHDLRYDVIVPLSRLVSPGQDSPSPYAAIGKSFKLDLGWRDIYGNQLGVVAWSDTIEHCYTDPLVPVSAWPCIQTRVYAGAAGSCEMVLEFAVDQNALPQGDDRAIVARELLRVLHQLLDPNTSISALSSLQPAARRNVDRAKLASFVARFRDDLLVGTAPEYPRHQISFRYDIPTDKPFHSVGFSIALERPEHLVGCVYPEKESARIPGAMKVQSVVRLVASINEFDAGNETTSQLAAEFQLAFAITQSGEARKFWLARGAADRGESEWWAIDDRVFPTADANPAVAYAMPPLARALMSGEIELRAIVQLAEADTDYLQNTFDSEEEQDVTVRAEDRDVDQLMSEFLDRVEAFLSAANAPVTAAVAALSGTDTSPFERVAREKARLLDVRGEDPPLLRELKTIFQDEPGTDAALKAARDELREACAQHLQRFYEVGCVVSKSLRSRAPSDWFEAAGNDRPKLYGQMTFAQVGGVQPDFRAMTRGIPLDAANMQLAAAVIPESKNSSAELGLMRYQLTHVERLVADAEEGRLAPSRWLTIVPLPAAQLPLIEVAAPIVAPFPLRRIPKNPELERPVVHVYDGEQAHSYAEQIALARRWTYGFDVGADFRTTDEVCCRLIYNAPVGSVPAALEPPAAPLVPRLFEALVAHEREVDPYWKTIIGEAGRRAAGQPPSGVDPDLRFRNACNRFAKTVKDVVDVFDQISTLGVTELVSQDRFVLTHDAMTTRIKFVDHMSDDRPWTVIAGEGRPWLRVRQIRANGRQPARTEAIVAGPADPVQADFTYEHDDENQQWRRRQVDVGRLDALRQQTIWAAASVRRNDKLAGRKARGEFVYRTPEVFLQELISPNLLRRRTVRLSPTSDLKLHTLLVQGLSPVLDNSGGLTRYIQVRADYESGQLTRLVECTIGPVGDEPGEGFTPEPDPKLLLASLRVSTVDVATLASKIENMLREMFTNEAIATQSDGDRGCLVLNVTIRASEDGKPGLPVLRLERLCLDLRRVTDI